MKRSSTAPGTAPANAAGDPSREVPLSERLLVRPEEAATLLGVGRSMIYEMMRTGQLPVIHLGRAARIALSDLNAWVEQRRSEASS